MRHSAYNSVRMNIVIIGSGMYVCGRGTGGFGTIMPAILEWSRFEGVGSVYIAGTDPKGMREAKKKVDRLKRDMNIDLPVKYFPESGKKNIGAYKDALKHIPKPAVCIVSVPDHLHYEIAGAAIEEGLHTLVVKPLVPTLKEARGLISLQDKLGVYCGVEFHKRYDLANIKLRDIVSSGEIGDPLYFTVEYSQRKSIPTEHFRRWADKTNIFQYLGIHYVDIIYFVTRAIPKRAMAIGQKNWLVSHGIDAHDSIQAIVEWELPSGKLFSSAILTNWIDPERTTAMSDQRIKVIGTKGRFESDQKRRGIEIVTNEVGLEEPNPYFCSAYGPEGDITYRGYGIESIRQFLLDSRRIENGELRLEDLEANRPTFRQSLVPTAVLEAVNRSLGADGGWIKIKDL